MFSSNDKLFMERAFELAMECLDDDEVTRVTTRNYKVLFQPSAQYASDGLCLKRELYI